MKDGVGSWYNEYLQPIFFDVVEKLGNSDVDMVFHHIAHSYIKNTVALLESISGHLRSYPVAQGMRLLIEFESDMDFLAKNPNNLPRLKKKVNKYRSDFIDEKKSWKETIIMSGNIHMIDDVSGEEVRTKDRVERVFDKDIYSFYCAYSHFNLYAICDDDENVQSFGDIRKANCQKASLIEYYPVILNKFIESLNLVLGEECSVTYDQESFRMKFEKLLNAIINAKLRSKNV